ncbi:MAG: HAMP domain-containing sensor histidine kinase [Cyanobacteria bacterium P01_D01_bin.56]
MDTAPQLSLSDILRNADGLLMHAGDQSTPVSRGQAALLAAEAEWQAAIAALAQVISTLPRSTTLATQGDRLSNGVVLSGPLPIFNAADLGQQLETWVVTPQPLADALNGQRSLLPSHHELSPAPNSLAIQALPLTLENPLLTERFCLAIMPTFSVGLVLGQPAGDSPCFQYSFDPHVLLKLWQHVRSHISPTVSDSLDRLDEKVSQTVAVPDYRLITRFTQKLLAHLPHRADKLAWASSARNHVHLASWENRESVDKLMEATAIQPALETSPMAAKEQDTELLQAMTHEIRTPLTTIRTLTRSLLRRKDVSAEVKKRLNRIDQECTQQIDRFNLIFQAVELETNQRDRLRSSLAPIALNQVFQDAIPRWQQQAQRRNVSLDVTLPPDLPRVTSDPTLLNQVLSGVVEWFTQCLPAQSHIQMRVTLAGHQMKLQFESEPNEAGQSRDGNLQERQPLKSLGQLLMFAPETGGLSLNLDATKNLFHFLGGKLTVRQRPEQGEVLTVFLPLDTREV